MDSTRNDEGPLLFIRGEYMVKPSLPAVAGMEASGTIVEVGPGVEGLAAGQRVACIALGAFAEYQVVRGNRILPLGDGLSFEQGAAFPVACLTAWHLLHSVHRLAAGETVVVHAAAGGVGLAAVQIAKAAGARVIGVVSNAQKAAAVRAAGADRVVDLAAEDFASALALETNGRGADLILDSIGLPTFEAGLSGLAPLGHIVLYGRAGGVPDAIDPRRLFSNSWTVSGFSLPKVYANRALMQVALAAIHGLMRDGRLRLPVHSVLPAEQATTALQALAGRQVIGKLLLRWT